MATEVEIKAWADEPQAVRCALSEKAVFSESFVKEDTYFCRSGELSRTGELGRAGELNWNPAETGRALFRLRRRNGTQIVTYKEKERDGRTEVNEEHEFTVSDPQAFIRFVEGIGFTPCIHKRKEGELFRWNSLNVELSYVDYLGWFVEIECIVENENVLEKAKERVYSVLGELGIGSDRIEKRYYIDMLQERGKE